VSQNVVTADSGTFAFLLQNGMYQITATKSGYLQASTEVVVNGDNITSIVLTLQPSLAQVTPGPPTHSGGSSPGSLSNLLLLFVIVVIAAAVAVSLLAIAGRRIQDKRLGNSSPPVPPHVK
jgi:hypothetical protein